MCTQKSHLQVLLSLNNKTSRLIDCLGSSYDYQKEKFVLRQNTTNVSGMCSLGKTYGRNTRTDIAIPVHLFTILWQKTVIVIYIRKKNYHMCETRYSVGFFFRKT